MLLKYGHEIDVKSPYFHTQNIDGEDVDFRFHSHVVRMTIGLLEI